MNAIEIRNLSKSFRGLYAVDHLNMTVPVGAIYGFIGENGSGKSTTEKLICGHLVADEGEIRLFGKDYTDSGVRVRVGALIENAGCFPNSSVYQNLKMQAINLNLKNADKEMTAKELEADCRTYIALWTKEMNRTKALLSCKYTRVEEDEAGYVRVYDEVKPEEIVTYLYENNILVSELATAKIGLEEYYIDLMKEKGRE